MTRILSNKAVKQAKTLASPTTKTKRKARITAPSIRSHTDLRNDDLCVSFGQRITSLRKARGWRQEDIAEAFGISREHISWLERGKRAPSLLMLEVLAAGFKVSISELLKGLGPNTD